MAEQNLPKDVQQALENLTGTDKELLKTVVSEKGELNEEALLNVSGGVSLSEAGTKTLNWLKNHNASSTLVGGSVGLMTVGAFIYLKNQKTPPPLPEKPPKLKSKVYNSGNYTFGEEEPLYED